MSGVVAEHFLGCHPEDGEAPEQADGAEVGLSEEACWHCRTMTPRGCHCPECLDGADYIPPTASYHCPTCGRWWAWMTGLNITQITFGSVQ